jgi:tetratricopeptide (TPR) repeat protein
VNRPAEGVAALARVPPERMTANYWEALTLAQHVLGDYRAELVAAERGRRQFPDRLTSLYNEARALAALGQVTEVERRLGEIVNLPAEPLFQPVEVLTAIAGELRAHGHPRPPTPRSRGRSAGTRPAGTVRTTPPFRAVYAEALYAAGRWDEARRLFEALAALPSGALRPPARAGYLGVLGGVAPDALDCRGT